MLNKNICKKCTNSSSKDMWDRAAKENSWNRGVITCDISGTYVKQIVSEPPSKWCPYILEHLVS